MLKSCVCPISFPEQPVKVMFGDTDYEFFENDFVGYVEVVKVGDSLTNFTVAVIGGMEFIAQYFCRLCV